MYKSSTLVAVFKKVPVVNEIWYVKLLFKRNGYVKCQSLLHTNKILADSEQIFDTVIYITMYVVHMKQDFQDLQDFLNTFARSDTIVWWNIWSCLTYRIAYSTEETFLPDFPVILKHSLRNYWKILKKCFLDTDNNMWT